MLMNKMLYNDDDDDDDDVRLSLTAPDLLSIVRESVNGKI